ncbi:MAG: hypothetical protein IKX71_08705 [Bacteroidales bacterium]|nr:hypothetical protein [Bacteroidales bacterium]
MRTIRKVLYCLAAIGFLAFVGCNHEPTPTPDPGPDDGGNTEVTYPFTVAEKISGTYKAGVHDAVVIEGDGFRAGLDSVAVVWQEEGDEMFETVKVAVTVSARQIKFGVSPAASYIGLPVKIAIKNDEYGTKPIVISNEVQFTKPTVSEGWIDDWGFRHAIKEKNPNFAKYMDDLEMLDVDAVAQVEHGGSTDNGGQNTLDLAVSWIESTEGIELFSGLKGKDGGNPLLAIWLCPELHTLDLSKSTVNGLNVICDFNDKLENVIAGPFVTIISGAKCPAVKKIDASQAKLLSKLAFSDPTTAIEDLDIRREMTGEYVVLGPQSTFPLADNAQVKIDAGFLYDHATGPWKDIYNGWTRGATIEVYSCVDINQKLGTVPSYAEDPEALAEGNIDENGIPANKYRIDDPNTEINEAPEGEQTPVDPGDELSEPEKDWQKGIFADPALVQTLKEKNSTIAGMVLDDGTIDPEKAANFYRETTLADSWRAIEIDWTAATSFEGIQVFKNLGTRRSATDGEFDVVIAWWCPNLVELDVHDWTAYVQLYMDSCASLEKVVLGPNMRGGRWPGCDKLKYFDMHLARFADWVQDLSNLEYANLTRTYTEGGTYNVDFNHWLGSGNVKNITFADNAEIHIDSEVKANGTPGSGQQVYNNIVSAWKNGARVFVHNVANYDDVAQVEAYSVNPTALEAK